VCPFCNRKRYSRVYYQFKPRYWYWMLVILSRKFCIATIKLMFVRNPFFQLCALMFVLFIAYTAQVRPLAD
jgi:hypothetical protein